MIPEVLSFLVGLFVASNFKAKAVRRLNLPVPNKKMLMLLMSNIRIGEKVTENFRRLVARVVKDDECVRIVVITDARLGRHAVQHLSQTPNDIAAIMRLRRATCAEVSSIRLTPEAGVSAKTCMISPSAGLEVLGKTRSRRECAEMLKSCHAVFVIGGDPGSLMGAFEHNQDLVECFLPRVRDGTCVWVGTSAGTIAAGSRVVSLEVKKGTFPKGLGLLPQSFRPHYDAAAHASIIAKSREKLRGLKSRLICMTDDDFAIVCDGSLESSGFVCV